MAVGTATAEVYLTLAEASETSTLSPLEREYIAVQTARSNGCRYCFTAHLVRALLLGADPDDLNGLGTRSLGSRIDAILSFAAVVLATRGAVADDLIAATHAAGIDDRGLVDIVTVVTENVLGNSINNLAGTPPEPGLQRLLARRGITAAIAELPTT
ncbi:MAG TPA: carboxymuconolactone decarboxylase family protein [Iamia sp.]